MSQVLVAALYKFVPVEDVEALQADLRPLCEEAEVFGTLLVAPEGINGTIAGSEAGVRHVLSALRADPRFMDLEHKESWTDKIPFRSMRVRLKKEIVALKVPGIDPREKVGTYVQPKDWNALIDRPDVVVIDTRNTYEIELGTFEGSMDPQTRTFGKFPEWLKQQTHLTPDTPIAMFCTGGIRCEKATSYLMEQGFEQVYHLQGGILKYLEEVPEADSRWKGECFVFDYRVTVDHDLKRGQYDLCPGCGGGVHQARVAAGQPFCHHCEPDQP